MLPNFTQCDVSDNHVVQHLNLVIFHSKPKKLHFLSLSASHSKSCLAKWVWCRRTKSPPFLRDCLPEIGYQAVSPYKCDYEKLNESKHSRDLLELDISKWPRNRFSLISLRTLLVVMPRAWGNGGKWACMNINPDPRLTF